MKSGEIRSMLRAAELIELAGELAMISVCKALKERKKASLEREELIIRLEQFLAKVKLLSGMLPICASCKKKHNEQGGMVSD